ncbi:MAG: SEL1-like repeat protein [Candidatus Methanomethylophilaceae archaeon]|nr:SEL1-like repeat protein [Candidatus Methanomethylophilaceae archaeon]
MLAFDRPEAIVRLGRMYAKGVGVEQDLEEAKKLMLQASRRKPAYRQEYEALLKETEGLGTRRPQEDI